MQSLYFCKREKIISFGATIRKPFLAEQNHWSQSCHTATIGARRLIRGARCGTCCCLSSLLWTNLDDSCRQALPDAGVPQWAPDWLNSAFLKNLQSVRVENNRNHLVILTDIQGHGEDNCNHHCIYIVFNDQPFSFLKKRLLGSLDIMSSELQI